MESSSEGDSNKNINDSSSRSKSVMKTPFQLETLENSYAGEMHPSDSARAELSEKLELSDRQLQMWFCHRRGKNKKGGGGEEATSG